MCPLWDSWATLTQEGLMEVGDIPPNSTRHESESRLCAISLDKERNYCMVSLWFRQGYGGTGIPEVE